MKETRFKQTEIGLIPEDWEILYLYNISQNAMYGVGAPSVKYDGTNKYIRITDINDTNGCFEPMPLVSPEWFLDKYIVKENDILIARTGASVGKCYLYKQSDGKLIFAGFLMRLNIINADSKFTFYQLCAEHYRNWITSESARTGQPGVNLQQIKSFGIPSPQSMREQHNIALALTSIDNLLLSLDKLIEKKRLIKQGAMQELLTGKKRLPGFTGEWVERRLGEIGVLAMCKRVFQEETSEKGDIPFYKIGTFGRKADAYISVNKYEQLKQMYRFPKKGDILISAAGTIGRSVVYDGKPAYFQDSNIIWLDHNEKQIINRFLYFIYQVIKWNTENTTIARLYNDNFNSMTIRFPLSIEEQQAIASALTRMDKEIESLEGKKAKYEQIKQGMMQQLLTGKIRLI